MPDDLCGRDVFTRSAPQAGPTRGLARGERAQHQEWEHLVDEVWGAGVVGLRAFSSHLTAPAHLLRLHGCPHCPPVNH